MFNFGRRKENKKLDEFDIGKFYVMLAKLNNLSDITAVISKDFNKTLKYVHNKYDKTYTVLANKETNSVIVVKEDFLQKFIVIDTLKDLINSNYKFNRYI